MIYLFVFIILCTLTYIYDIFKVKKLSILFYVIEAVILILLAGFRYRVGVDSLAYENSFDYLPGLNELYQTGFSGLEYQPLWYILNVFVKIFSNSFVLFQLTHAAIINIVIFIIVHQYCKHKFTAILLYYILLFPYFNMEILRESLSVIIFLLSYKYVLKQKYIKYLLLAVTAYLFHASALFLFTVPFLTYYFQKKIGFLQLIVIVAIAIVAVYFLLDILIDYLPLRTRIIDKLVLYTSLKANSNGIIKGIFDLIPATCVMFLLKKTNNNNTFNNSVINIYILLLLLSFNIIGTARLLNYFSMFWLIIVVNLLYESKYYNMTVKAVILFVLLCIILSKTYYYAEDLSRYNNGINTRFYHRYIPYHSVFNPQIDHRREIIFLNRDNIEP